MAAAAGSPADATASKKYTYGQYGVPPASELVNFSVGQVRVLQCRCLRLGAVSVHEIEFRFKYGALHCIFSYVLICTPRRLAACAIYASLGQDSESWESQTR